MLQDHERTTNQRIVVSFTTTHLDEPTQTPEHPSTRQPDNPTTQTPDNTDTGQRRH